MASSSQSGKRKAPTTPLTESSRRPSLTNVPGALIKKELPTPSQPGSQPAQPEFGTRDTASSTSQTRRRGIFGFGKPTSQEASTIKEELQSALLLQGINAPPRPQTPHPIKMEGYQLSYKSEQQETLLAKESLDIEDNRSMDANTPGTAEEIEIREPMPETLLQEAERVFSQRNSRANSPETTRKDPPDPENSIQRYLTLTERERKDHWKHHRNIIRLPLAM